MIKKGYKTSLLCTCIISMFFLTACGNVEDASSNNTPTPAITESVSKDTNAIVIDTATENKISVKQYTLSEYFTIKSGDGKGELRTNLVDAVGEGPSSFCINNDNFYILDYTDSSIAVYDMKGNYVSNIDIKSSADYDDLISVVSSNDKFYVLDSCINNTGTPKVFVLDKEGKIEDTVLLEEEDNRMFLNLINDSDGKAYIKYWNFTSCAEEYVPVDNTKIIADGIWKITSVDNGVFNFTNGERICSINCYDLFADLPKGSIEADYPNIINGKNYGGGAEVLDGTNSDSILFKFYADVNGNRRNYICSLNIKENTLNYIDIESALKDSKMYILPVGNAIFADDNGNIYVMVIYEENIKIMMIK